MEEDGAFFCALYHVGPPAGLGDAQETHLNADEISHALEGALAACLGDYGERKTVQQADRAVFAASLGKHCKLVSREGLCGMMYGHTGASDPGAADNSGEWLLDFYSKLEDLGDLELTRALVDALAQLQGPVFCFVLYDAARRRLLAARDPEGNLPLYWGVTSQGLLLLGTDARDLQACYPSATAFPAGTLFLGNGELSCSCPGSMGWTMEGGSSPPGRLRAFIPSLATSHPWRHIKAIPRVTSKGTLCGAVYRVESERALAAYQH